MNFCNQFCIQRSREWSLPGKLWSISGPDLTGRASDSTARVLALKNLAVPETACWTISNFRLSQVLLFIFQAISEAFKMATDPDLEWTATILDVKPQVILHDRLMTDAALGTVPIKSEHSYSLTSDGDSIPDSPLSLDNKMDGEHNSTEVA